MISFAVIMLAVALQTTPQPQPAPGKVATPVNDPVSAKGCLRGNWLTIRETDATDLGAVKEIKLSGPRSLMKQLADYRNYYIDVVGIVRREGGNSDRLDMRKRQKVGSKTTISVGATAEQMTGTPVTPEVVILEIQAFEPLGEKCPGR
jgi:hypothetical protein